LIQPIPSTWRSYSTSIEELPEYLHQKIEAKFTTDLLVFLVSYFKGWRSKVTQFCEPIFDDLAISTSTATEVKINEEVEDPYSTR
jgi:hypothetical protein